MSVLLRHLVVWREQKLTRVLFLNLFWFVFFFIALLPLLLQKLLSSLNCYVAVPLRAYSKWRDVIWAADCRKQYKVPAGVHTAFWHEGILIFSHTSKHTFSSSTRAQQFPHYLQHILFQWTCIARLLRHVVHYALVVLLHPDSVCIMMSISSGSLVVLVVLQKQREQADTGFELSLALRQ